MGSSSFGLDNDLFGDFSVANSNTLNSNNSSGFNMMSGQAA